MSEGRTIGVKTSDSERRKWLKSLKVGDEVLIVDKFISYFETVRGHVVSVDPHLIVRHALRFSSNMHDDRFARTTGKMRYGDSVIMPLGSRAEEHRALAHRMTHCAAWFDVSLESLERVRDILKKEGLWSV
jgi:hypothetical protein